MSTHPGVRSVAFAILSLAQAFSAAAHAQDAAPSAPGAADQARLVYEADFYAQYAPRSALDMIDRTPGFVLTEGTERRGFSGAVGNVLVDGERPIAKSQTLKDILARIPASQVLRIELLRGGETAGDASGFAVLANVVRSFSTGQGYWKLGTEYAGRAPAPNGSASWSGRLGRTDYNLGGNLYSLHRQLPGDRVITDGDGAVTATRAERSPRYWYGLTVNGDASRPMLGGRMRLTGEVASTRYHEESAIETFSADGTLAAREVNPFTQDELTWESGLSFERDLGPWELTLDALATRKGFESGIVSTSSDAAGEIGAVFSQAIERDSGETILRATLERALSSRHEIEASVEGALNTQDQRLALTLDLGTGAFPIPVPDSNLTVTERRGDAYLAHRWTPGRQWSVETRLAAEASRLSFTGDTDQSTDLVYFKPSLRIARNLGKRDQLRLRLYRDVAQLDFTDFVSAAAIADDRIIGGNPDLRPETSWRIEATADLHFGTLGAFSLMLFRHWVANTIDLVPVGPPEARVDAPGNIGDGDVWGAALDLQVPLRPIVPGGLLTLDATVRRSRVTDPVTGERREASDFVDRELKAAFRQDLTRHKLAWGLTYTGKPELAFYRLAEIERRRDSPTLDLWFETTAIEGLTLSATIASLLGTAERRERIFYEPDRKGRIVRTEYGERRPGRWLILSVSGSL